MGDHLKECARVRGWNASHEAYFAGMGANRFVEGDGGIIILTALVFNIKVNVLTHTGALITISAPPFAQRGDPPTDDIYVGHLAGRGSLDRGGHYFSLKPSHSARQEGIDAAHTLRHNTTSPINIDSESIAKLPELWFKDSGAVRWLTDGIVTGKKWLEGRMSSAVKTQKITAPGYVRFRSKNADVLVYDPEQADRIMKKWKALVNSKLPRKSAASGDGTRFEHIQQCFKADPHHTSFFLESIEDHAILPALRKQMNMPMVYAFLKPDPNGIEEPGIQFGVRPISVCCCWRRCAFKPTATQFARENASSFAGGGAQGGRQRLEDAQATAARPREALNRPSP